MSELKVKIWCELELRQLCKENYCALVSNKFCHILIVFCAFCYGFSVPIHYVGGVFKTLVSFLGLERTQGHAGKGKFTESCWTHQRQPGEHPSCQGLEAGRAPGQGALGGVELTQGQLFSHALISFFWPVRHSLFPPHSRVLIPPQCNPKSLSVFSTCHLMWNGTCRCPVQVLSRLEEQSGHGTPVSHLPVLVNAPDEPHSSSSNA